MAYGYVPPTTYRDPNDKYSATPQGAYGQQWKRALEESQGRYPNVTEAQPLRWQ